LTKEQNLVLSALTLSEASGAGATIDAAEMPFYTEVEYVEVYNYDVADKEFKYHFRDDFLSL